MNSFIKTDISLQDLARHLECEYKGSSDTRIKHIGDINNTMYMCNDLQENCIYFLQNEKTFQNFSGKINNSILLSEKPFDKNGQFNNVIYASDNSKLIFIKLLKYFNTKIHNPMNEKYSIHPHAKIGAGTKIAPGAYIGEGVVIGENCRIYSNAVIEPYTRISKNCEIHSGVFIARHSVIGSNCIIYPNAVIGSDGFGYTDAGTNRYRIPQIGNVVLGNYVDIGAGTTIDRSTIESTIIGDDTKIDNQVHIAHNCIVGSKVYIAGKASLAGSVRVHNGAILAGGCGIRDHVCIGEGSVILAFTGIEEDTLPHQTYFGIPGRKVRDMHRINSALTQLPELVKTVKHLKEKLEVNPDLKN